MEEIIQGVVAALHILAKDPHTRAIIHSLNCIPLFVTVSPTTHTPLIDIVRSLACHQLVHWLHMAELYLS